MILRASLSMASRESGESGVPAQREKQYSIKPQMKALYDYQKFRLAKERPFTMENAQLAAGSGSHLGNMVDPRKIKADGEAQTFTTLGFSTQIKMLKKLT